MVGKVGTVFIASASHLLQIQHDQGLFESGLIRSRDFNTLVAAHEKKALDHASSVEVGIDFNTAHVPGQAVEVPVPVPGFFVALAGTFQAHKIAFLEQAFSKNALSVFAQQALHERIECFNLLLLHTSAIESVRLMCCPAGLAHALCALLPCYSFIKPAHLVPFYASSKERILETTGMDNKRMLIKLNVIVGQCLTTSKVTSQACPFGKPQW